MTPHRRPEFLEPRHTRRGSRLARHVIATVVTGVVFLVSAPVLGRPRIPTIPVVVAAVDLPEGYVLNPTLLVVAQWPAGTRPAGAYASLESVTNRMTRVAIFKGEALVPGRLAADGIAVRREVTIAHGKRAYGVRIKDDTGIAALIQPNSRVDVMVILDDPNVGAGRVARLFMQNMRVLSIGAEPERAEDGRRINVAVAAIEVTPQEAERLAIAAAQGQFQLMLRGYGDPDSVRRIIYPAASDVIGGLRPRPTAPQK